MKHTTQQNAGATDADRLEGINRDLWEWLCSGLSTEHSLVRRALQKATKYQGETGIVALRASLCEALAAESSDKRIQAAEEFLYEHWHAHVELGPYPLPYALAKVQRSSDMYEEYRDHVAHQLKVYLLGLYFFDQCERVSQPIRDEIASELRIARDGPAVDPEFMLRWLATSAAHDVGYLAEGVDLEKTASSEGSDDANDVTEWKYFLDQCREMLTYPIAGQLGLWNPDSEICKSFKAGFNKIRSSVRLQTFQFPDLPLWTEIHNSLCEDEKDSWNTLAEAGRKAQLGNSESQNKHTIEIYLEFAKDLVGPNRPRFLDHGGMSALLLLKSWHAYAHHLDVLIYEKKFVGLLSDFATKHAAPELTAGKEVLADARNWNKWWSKTRKIGQRTVRAAAAAIAVHNISPSTFDGKQSIYWTSKFSKDFCIHLTGDNAIPLAFLLRLVDAVQVWDRSKSRSLMINDIALATKDISIRTGPCEKGIDPKQKVFLWLPRDLANVEKFLLGKLPGDVAAIWKGLEEALAEEEIESVVGFDGTGVDGAKTFAAAMNEASNPERLASDDTASSTIGNSLPDTGDNVTGTLVAERPCSVNQPPPAGADSHERNFANDPLLSPTPNPTSGGVDVPIRSISGYESGSPDENVRAIITGNETPSIRACNQNGSLSRKCEVMWSAAHVTADYCTTSRCNHETFMIFCYFAELGEVLRKLLPAGTVREKYFLLQSACSAANHSRQILRHFTTSVVPEGSRPIPEEAIDSLREFLECFKASLRAEPLDDVVTAVRGIAENFAHCNFLNLKLPAIEARIRRNLHHIGILERVARVMRHVLEEDMDTGTNQIHLNFEGSFAPELSYEALGVQLRTKLQELPHLCMPVRAWQKNGGLARK